MSFDLSFHNKSFQESMHIPSPDNTLNQFYATKLTKTPLNSTLTASRDSLTNLKQLNLQNSQTLPKYSQSFSRHDSGNDSQLSSYQFKTFKDVDSIKQHVLSTSLIGSDKAIIDAVLGQIKEITSGLNETIKSLSNELINMNAKYEIMNAKLTDLTSSNRTKDEQICKLTNQIEVLNLKLNESVTYTRMSQDNILVKQNKIESHQTDLINKLDKLMSQKMNDLTSKCINQQNDIAFKFNQKFDDLRSEIKSHAATNIKKSISEHKLNTFVSICKKYKRIRKEKQKKDKTKLITSSRSKVTKPKQKTNMSLDKTSLKLVNTFNLLSLGSELKWSRIKDSKVDHEDDDEDLNCKASVFDLNSY